MNTYPPSSANLFYTAISIMHARSIVRQLFCEATPLHSEKNGGKYKNVDFESKIPQNRYVFPQPRKRRSLIWTPANRFWTLPHDPPLRSEKITNKADMRMARGSGRLGARGSLGAASRRRTGKGAPACNPPAPPPYPMRGGIPSFEGNLQMKYLRHKIPPWEFTGYWEGYRG